MMLSLKRILYGSVMVLICMAAGRAASQRFQEKLNTIRNGCQAELAKLGLTRDAAKAKYPTPEISMVSVGCVLPGQTGQVVVKGKFPPGMKFVFENDNIEVVNESVTATEYRATVKAAPGTGPQTAGVTAIHPVTCMTARHDRAVAIGGQYEFAMDTSNGWRVVARSADAGGGCGDPNRSTASPYQMAFYKKGEVKPFETRKADLYFSVYESTNFRFRISEEDAEQQADSQNLETLVKKMMDPKLTDAQRQQVMADLQKIQQQQMAKVQRFQDPNYVKALEAKKKQFGCTSLSLRAAGETVAGDMVCSELVGRNITVNGTLKLVGK